MLRLPLAPNNLAFVRLDFELESARSSLKREMWFEIEWWLRSRRRSQLGAAVCFSGTSAKAGQIRKTPRSNIRMMIHWSAV